MKGAVFLIIGIIVTVVSLYLNSTAEANKFAVFIFFGIGLILFGVYRMQQEKTKNFKVPEWGPKGAKAQVQQQAQQKPQQQAPQQQPGQAAQGTKVCGQCGTRMPGRANFCAICGGRV